MMLMKYIIIITTIQNQHLLNISDCSIFVRGTDINSNNLTQVMVNGTEAVTNYVTESGDEVTIKARLVLKVQARQFPEQ